ncbi:MAG: efflux RND transporter periplasmic adaptor subunit [Woeseiaceae bacterium]|nr:efflux RND transporter periplasmic adaptor subunit [Woeseiaceae bacterium]
MTRIPTIFLILGCALFIAGCSDADSDVPVVIASDTSTNLVVRADGELVASESLPIALPGSIRMGFNIAWMAPEFSEIRKGDVIARFDDVQIVLDREAAALNVAKSEFKLANTERTSGLELTRIGHESLRVDGEREITETYEEVDERMFSRNEIIDALSDLEYLGAQASFLDWQFDTFDQRAQAEQNMINAERAGEMSKLEKQDMALNMMELRSPADGTFVYARTPWGEKLGKGKTVFPGRPIGLLPVRGKVQARLFVPENDAVGLEEGQLVRLRLDAATEREFTASVISVSPVASPRNRTDPQKFVTVEASIDEVDVDLMRVGNRLRAEIITGRVEEGFVLPAQAVHGDVSNAYVYVLRGQRAERRDVTIGRRSPDRVEVTAGLSSGDRVSLVLPVDAS